MKKKMIALMLMCSMVASMVACGNAEEAGKAEETAKTETTTAAEETKAEESEAVKEEETAESDTAEAPEVDLAIAPFEETVTITTVDAVDSSIDYVPEGDTMEDNIWIRMYKDKLNIEVKYDWTSDEYETKLNLAIASGTLPDAFTVNEAQLQDLMEAGLLYDISEVYETYGTEKLQELRELNSEYFELATDGDALYGIPGLNYGDIANINYIWIRQDWMNEQGLEAPQTMDDVVEIAKVFMEEYGAKAGIYEQSNLYYLKMIAHAWQAYPTQWIEAEDGSIMYGAVHENMKNALADWAEWYKQGIINSDFATLDSVSEAIVNGQVGVQPFENWFGYWPCPDMLNNLTVDAVFHPYAIPSATDEQVMAPINYSNAGFTVVSKDCEHPEAVIKLINANYYVDELWGSQEEYDKLNEGGANMVHTVPFRVHDTQGDVNKYKEVAAAIEKMDPSGVSMEYYEVADGAIKWIESKDVVGVGHFLQNRAYSIADNILNNDAVNRNILWGATPQKVLDYGSTLDDLLIQGWTKIIMGEEDIDYFDELVAEWKAAGGDIITQAMNEAYGN